VQWTDGQGLADYEHWKWTESISRTWGWMRR
jgi:hypothetical protein